MGGKGGKKKLKRVTYLGYAERGRYKLKFGSDGVSYQAGKRQFPGGMYVMTPGGDFYGGPERVNENGQIKHFHHSSFLSGMPVAAAGHLKAPSGDWAMTIDLESGHYQPLTGHMIGALKQLKRKLGSLDTVGVQPFAKEHHWFSKHIQATKLLKEFAWLKVQDWDKMDAVQLRKQAPWMSLIITNKNRKQEAYQQLKLGVKEV